MIIYKDIEQGTPEWLELKWGRIGGTASEGLFKKTDDLFIDLLSQRSEEFDIQDSFSSNAMDRGTELEPYAREYLEKYTNISFKEVGWIQSEENDLLGISPDGISECEKVSAEFKCFGRKQHTRALVKNEIPKKHIAQCIHYFTVNNKLETLYFMAFRPEAKKHFIKKLTLDSLVNIGTEKNPVFKSIKECKEIAIKEADLLLKKIDAEIEKLNF